jgi:hypothetical protein
MFFFQKKTTKPYNTINYNKNLKTTTKQKVDESFFNLFVVLFSIFL